MASLAQIGDGGIDALEPARGQHHAGASARVDASHVQADAAGGAGDQGRVTLQAEDVVQAHAVYLF